jgi:hypothetical protein
MQAEGSATPATLVGTVRGLGVCDVLRVEFAASQRADLETAMTARIESLRQRIAEFQSTDRARLLVSGEEEDSAELCEPLRIIRRLRDELPTTERPFTVIGPAGIVLELVADGVVAVIGRTSVAFEGLSWSRVARLDLAAVQAWLQTALDCRAVESFSFDRDRDPTAAW